jgi:hypothetical protein
MREIALFSKAPIITPKVIICHTSQLLKEILKISIESFLPSSIYQALSFLQYLFCPATLTLKFYSVAKSYAKKAKISTILRMAIDQKINYIALA